MKPPGPVQEYVYGVTPPVALAVKVIISPTQATDLLEVAVAVGFASAVAAIAVFVGVVHPASVAST